MFRYRLTRAIITKIKEYLADNTKEKPSILSKHDGSIRKGKLFIGDKEAIAIEDSEKKIRDLVLSGKTPLSRDALFYFLSKTYYGISRAAIDKVLRSQRVIRETDNNKASTTRAKRKVHKKGQLEFDLIDIRFKDFPFKPTGRKHLLSRDFGFIFSCVDKLTGLAYGEYIPGKFQKYTDPVAKRCFNWYAKVLKTPISKFFAMSDAGDEFNFALYKKWGLRHKIVARGPAIESKNSHIQRVLHRIAKMGITNDINELVTMAIDICNNTQSSITKVTPNEAAGLPMTSLAVIYNKKRGKDSGIKIKSLLKVGDRVRLNLLKSKEKGDTFYKAYKGTTWSKSVFTIIGKRGNSYKIDDGTKKRFVHADNLKRTDVYDKKSEKIIADRMKNLKKRVQKKTPSTKKSKRITLDIDESDILTSKRQKKKVDYKKYY